MFPTKSGREFSPSFPKTAVHLYTQFLRIFAHLYHAHFRDILHLSLEAHLNVSPFSTDHPFLIFPFLLHHVQETRPSMQICGCGQGRGRMNESLIYRFYPTPYPTYTQSLFAHFLMFGLTFELLDPKECRAPREGWGFVVGDLMDVSTYFLSSYKTRHDSRTEKVKNFPNTQAWRSMGILEGGQA
jgi:hypothetical protein